MTLVPPRAPRHPVELAHHGRSRIDPYFWLRAENWRAVMQDPSLLDPEIRAYLDAENAYTDAALTDMAGLRATLVTEMRGRIKEDDSSVPDPDGPYAYYWRYDAGGQHPIYCRRARGGGPETEQVLLHGDREAEGLAYYSVHAFSPSYDHQRAAYAVDITGAESCEVRIRELDTGSDLSDRVFESHGDIAWSADGRFFFYIKLDADHRPRQVMRHRLGTPQSDDIIIYDEPDPAFYVGIAQSLSRRFIFIHTHDHCSSDVRLIRTDAPEAAPVLVEPRRPDHEYSVTDHGDRLFILTNADGAQDFKIMTTPLANPGQAHWRDWLDHEPGRLILDLLVYKNHAVRLERINALPRIVVTRVSESGGRCEEHVIDFDEEAYSLGMRPGLEYATQRFSFVYSSMARPSETFAYDLETRERMLLKRQEIPSGHNPSNYVVRRLEAPGCDGALIPITLIHRRELPIDGGAPLLLYGYGAYGIASPAGFSSNRLSLVDRGFVYAIAHIRGGKDKGDAWYRQGKLFHKRNTFDDFIAAGRHLIAKGFTSTGRIVAHGGSAGGLLMGAVANIAPDLFGGIIAEVPFVDTLTTILDANLPLTPPEWTEWGNPLEDPAVYDYMASYSPYDNVEAKAYPAIFALGGLSDPRVTYWEPAKWIAKLRALKTNDALTLLRINMEAGHGGAAGRFDRLEEVALVYAFAIKVAGLVK